jgi:hypothetical protein
MIDRRSFLLWAASAAGVAGGAATFWRWQDITASVDYSGRAEGHYLRDHHSLPEPTETIETDVVILG